LSNLPRHELIDRIVEEVIYRLKELEPVNADAQGTVVLVTSFIPSPKDAIEKLNTRFGGDVTYIVFGDTEFPSKFEKVLLADELGTDAVLKRVNEAANVVLLTPRLKLIDNIAQGNDEDFVEFLIVRSLLWGRCVSVLIDFEPPAFKRNTFYEKVLDIIEVLEGIGIGIISYDCSLDPLEAKSLITEADVMDAWKKGAGQLLGAAGAIVTPSAKDKAKELGLEIN
jgi:hypothetical protein